MDDIWKALLDISKTNLIIMDAVLSLQNRLAPDTVRQIPNRQNTSEQAYIERAKPKTQNQSGYYRQPTEKTV